MTDSVVSTYFGKRPILQVPALQFSGRESSMLRLPQPPTLPVANNSSFPHPLPGMPGPSFHNQPSSHYPPSDWYHNRLHLPALHRNHSAPARHYYNSQDPQLLGERAHPSTFYPSQTMHPQMGNNFSGYDRPPPPRVPYPNYGLPNLCYNITCDLEYGRIVTIDLRECFGEFRGVPPFLRSELMRTYGSHPYTKVKVRMEGEEFHVFVNHEKRRGRGRLRKRGRDSDTDSDILFDDEYDDEEEADEYRMFPHRGRRSEFDSDRRRLRYGNHGARPRGVIID